MKLVVIVLLFGLTTLVGASLLDNILPDWNITLPDISIICQNLQFASISEECALQLRIVCANSTLRATFLDASAKFPYDGLAYATRWSYGNFDQCLAIDHEDDEGRILGKHCAVGLTIPDFSGNLSDTDSYYLLGTCNPNACYSTDFNSILSNVTGTYIPVFQDVMCTTVEDNSELTNLDIFVIILFSVVASLMVISTMYDIYLHQKQRKPKSLLPIAFSMYTNGKKIFHVDRGSKEQIYTFNGIRVISMMWIIAGHGFVGIPNVAVSNQGDIDRWQESFHSFYINTAHLGVDTFFFMSGFLMGYQYLKQKPKPWKAHVRTVPYMYIHRLLRLTPSLVVFFFFIITVFRLMGTGPMWNEYTNIVIDSCKEYWWSYMLYIQNYYNWDDMCMVPTWYIAADMQMFILSPLIAIPVAVALSNSSRFKATMKRLFVLNVFFTLLPLTIKLAVPEYKNTYDTHSRLINYFLGFMLATFMRTRQDRPFLYMVKSKHIDRTNLILWIIVLCGMLATVIGFQYIILEDDETNTNIYHSFMRPAWCIGLSWIVYSSHHGYGGFVSWLLCRPTFQVLGKLTYSMYLLHSMVLVYFICTVRTQYYFSDYNAFYMFCGHYVVTVIVSFFWTLAFESPVLIIEKLMFGGGKKKREDKTGIENDNNVNIVNNVNSDNNVNIDNNVNKELEPNGRVESENKRYVAC